MIVALAAALALQLSSPMFAASSCENPNKDASVLVAAPPQLSEAQLKSAHASKAALIFVSLDARGKIIKTSIAQSSGSSVIDRAALAAAEASTYSPATRNCSGVAGRYLFRVQVGP